MTRFRNIILNFALYDKYLILLDYFFIINIIKNANIKAYLTTHILINKVLTIHPAINKTNIKMIKCKEIIL